MASTTLRPEGAVVHAQGVKGLSRVLLAAAVVAVAVFVLQLAFTCAPVMQSLFASTPGSLGPFHSRNWRRETAQ